MPNRVRRRAVVTAAEPPSVVDMPDENFRLLLEETLNKSPDEAVTAGDRQALTKFGVSAVGIGDLTGIAHAVNLRLLALDGNVISDLTPLAGRIRLAELILTENRISSVAALAGMTQMHCLHLGRNQVEGIFALAELDGNHAYRAAQQYDRLPCGA